MDAGHLHIDKVNFSLDEVLTNLTSIVSIDATKKGVKLIVEKGENLPTNFIGDPLRLGQILINLVSNAIKFSDKGEVLLLITQKNAEATIEFAVIDSGIGITKTQMKKLFKPFTQADSTIWRRFGGTGLGLMICQELVKLMDGEINVISKPNIGSTFSFFLPLEVGQKQTTTKLPHTDSKKNKNLQKRFIAKQILLAEDNHINQIIARELMEEFGLKVTIANNGQEAIEKINNGTFDILLMDLQMPVIDGYQAAKTIRGQKRFKNLPIIAMTAHSVDSIADNIKAIGMVDHITKPIDPDILYQTLSRWLPDAKTTEKEPFQQPQGNTSQLPYHLPGIDIHAALGRVRNNHNLLRKLLIEFYHDHIDAYDFLEDSIKIGDIKAAQLMAHTIKGTTSNLGAVELAKAAEQLETACIQDKPAESRLKAFQKEWRIVIAGLSLLATDNRDNNIENITDIDHQNLTLLLTELSEFLRIASPDAIELIPEVKYALGGHHKNILSTLTINVESYEFEESIKNVQQLTKAVNNR
jgi:CheY-like chemotaxis protein/HPt (histidine-containing phosphotransfer) domain-containing protein